VIDNLGSDALEVSDYLARALFKQSSRAILEFFFNYALNAVEGHRQRLDASQFKIRLMIGTGRLSIKDGAHRLGCITK